MVKLGTGPLGPYQMPEQIGHPDLDHALTINIVDRRIATHHPLPLGRAGKHLRVHIYIAISPPGSGKPLQGQFTAYMAPA